jgi:hypothetical protein
MTARALLQSFAFRLATYEAGDLDRDEVISLLQDLLDSGVIFEPQGSDLHEAERLISAGLLRFDWSAVIDR